MVRDPAARVGGDRADSCDGRELRDALGGSLVTPLQDHGSRSGGASGLDG